MLDLCLENLPRCRKHSLMPQKKIFPIHHFCFLRPVIVLYIRVHINFPRSQFAVILQSSEICPFSKPGAIDERPPSTH